VKPALNTMPDNTPVLVGAGQSVEREATASSPMAIASRAAAQAIADTQGNAGLAAAIDTIAVIKIFSDSSNIWASGQKRSNNPPESIARAIGATPSHRIYSETGGNEPMSLLFEFARDIAAGEREVVLLSGAEAIRNQRQASREERDLGWEEEFDVPLEDRGFGKFVANDQERFNGMVLPVFYYNMIEQARRAHLGLDLDSYRHQMAALLESFSAVAANNPYAQWPGQLSTEDILGASPLTHLYTKRMIAQDSVNQGAAVLLTSLGKAKQLGIPEQRWVFLHGAAQGMDVDLSLREQLRTSGMACMVADRALDMAEKQVTDIDLIDIYSCFPCAVTAISDHLGLAGDGSHPLTLTGGLPYFGGPGNNYSMHGLAEALWQVRRELDSFAYVHANGGVLSKHASGIFSRQPGRVDWDHDTTVISQDKLPQREQIADPSSGKIVSYSVNYHKDTPVQAIALAETEQGQRFVSCTHPQDLATVNDMLQHEPNGRAISVRPGEIEHSLHFKMETNT
jgi:acetyl-CoA C-acetyltransferase